MVHHLVDYWAATMVLSNEHSKENQLVTRRVMVQGKVHPKVPWMGHY